MAAADSATNLFPSAVSRYLVPDLPGTEDVLIYLRRIDEARWYSNFGPLVCEFERLLQRLLTRADRAPQHGPIHLTTLVSGHYALEIALQLVGITRGKKVLLPAITFPACPLAIQHTGAEAILSDIDPNNWTLTPEIARAAATRTKVDAVMPVALYGIPLPTAQWDEFSRDMGIPVVIDAAAAVEAQEVPRTGLIAHSLHATKPFGIGEGGILASRDASVIDRARRYTNFGTSDRICYMDGSNAKMSEYHAAVALAQLNRWSGIKQRRRDLLQLYIRHLEPLKDLLTLQPAIQTAVVSCLVLMLDRPDADRVLKRLSENGIASHRTYFPPLYRHPHFAELAVCDANGYLAPESDVERKRAHMVNSERLFAHLVGVPFHSFMVESDVIRVVAEVGRQLRVSDV